MIVTRSLCGKLRRVISLRDLTKTYGAARAVDSLSLDVYSTVERMGRKSRLGPNQRARLWPVFAAVHEALAAERHTTWTNVFTGLAKALEGRPAKPFDHVIIDEAQDLAPAELQFVAALAPAEPNGLFLSGDIGQRISSILIHGRA